jgi:hypothetical protein
MSVVLVFAVRYSGDSASARTLYETAVDGYESTRLVLHPVSELLADDIETSTLWPRLAPACQGAITLFRLHRASASC